jgi:cytochrome c oxidase subunit I+III
MVALVPFDWQVHDTYFIVAHLHYVLFGGMVFPLFAAFYYWAPMMSSRALSERLGKWIFWLMFGGFQVTFLPMHLTGLMGMPRRVYTYLPGSDLTAVNFVSTVGAMILGSGVLLFLVDLARNFRFAADDNAGNVYGGGTLEWLPTGLYSTRSIPVVKSRDPLWDDPKLADDVEAGRYFLPNAPTGHRETLITSPLRAEPQYVQIMPGPSAWPLFAAIFTAGFFVILTLQAYGVAVTCGVLAIVCVIRWLWETDRPVALKEAEVGPGIVLPTYVTGPRTHGWWAMTVLLIVVGMVWAMTVYGWFYVYGAHPAFWKPAPASGSAWGMAAGYIAAAGLAVFSRRWLAREKSTLWSPPTLLLSSAGLLGVVFAFDLWSWLLAGLDPQLTAQWALVAAFLSQAGFMVVIAVMMALYMGARTSRGLVTRPQNNSFDLTVIFLAYTGVQGGLTALLVRLFPGGL